MSKRKEVTTDEPRKAFTVVRIPGGWSFHELTYSPSSGQILSTSEMQPDIKDVALERFKIAAVKWWNAQEAMGAKP